MALRALSLCSGIGGLDLALRRLGVVSVGYVERDAYAAAVLVARMEEQALDRAPIWSDISTFDARAWRGRVDLVAAGYPCQPFSNAGLRRGSSDPRHLWPHVARIVDETDAWLVVLENVAGHVRLGLRDVLGDLARLGFDAEWGLFSAAEAGAPHRRLRLFVLAYRDLNGLRELGRGCLLDGEREARRDDADGRCGPQCDMVDAPCPCCEGQEWEQPEPQGRAVPGAADPVVAYASGEREGAEQLGGQPRGALAPSEVVADTDHLVRQRRAGEPRRRPPRGITPGRPSAWPPGPGDRDSWARVLAVDPLLAPALPAVRGVADGLPGPLVYRVDRLRCLGNAVVPDQAELAILELARRALG